MRLFIKNMASIRCKLIVRSVFETFGVDVVRVEQGEVEIVESLQVIRSDVFRDALFRFGFEPLDDRESVLIERIKNVVVEMIHYADELPDVPLPEYLSGKLQLEYAHLATVFSEVKGITIDHFVLLQKMERVKELLMYSDLNLSGIAGKLHFGDETELSEQLGKTTGLTPAFFESMKQKRRQVINNR